MNISHLNPPYTPMSSGRSDLEIDRDLSPILEKIRGQVRKNLEWTNSVIPVSRNLLLSAIEEPRKALYKVAFCAVGGYIQYLLVRGIFSGIEVDFDSNFTDIFSSDRDVRILQGLNMTNGDQAGQFMIDSAILGYGIYNVVFRESYCRFAGKVINKCYKPHIKELLKSIVDFRIENENIDLRLIRCKEDIDRLYKNLRKDLSYYDQEAVYYQEPEFILETQEIRIEIPDPTH